MCKIFTVTKLTGQFYLFTALELWSFFRIIPNILYRNYVEKNNFQFNMQNITNIRFFFLNFQQWKVNVCVNIVPKLTGQGFFWLYALIVWSYKLVLPAFLHIELYRSYQSNSIFFVIDENFLFTVTHKIAHIFLFCKFFSILIINATIKDAHYFFQLLRQSLN